MTKLTKIQTITSSSRKAAGFTLVELMVVVSIVGLISTLAYPSFSEYIVRAKRQIAQETLYRLTSQQEQFFADNKTYARSLTELGYSDDLMGVDENGNVVPFSTANKDYGLNIIWAGTPTSAGTTLTYAVYAWPYGGQFNRDTKCGAQWLDESGQRWSFGSDGADKCW
jgi:type IV pilus assembly protein PilE